MAIKYVKLEFTEEDFNRKCIDLFKEGKSKREIVDYWRRLVDQARYEEVQRGADGAGSVEASIWIRIDSSTAQGYTIRHADRSWGGFDGLLGRVDTLLEETLRKLIR